jgi:hypothetical protein
MLIRTFLVVIFEHCRICLIIRRKSKLRLLKQRCRSLARVAYLAVRPKGAGHGYLGINLFRRWKTNRAKLYLLRYKRKDQ